MSASFIVQKYGENLTQAVTILENFIAQIFTTHIHHKIFHAHTKAKYKNCNRKYFLICQMDGKNVETEHKNQILKIKRFAVFKNHKTLLSACGI